MIDTENPRILIIEDDDLVRRTVCAMLETAGYETATAENGRQGLEWMREHSVEVVITDIYMPEKEGLETIMELRRLHPAVKIMAISGGGDTGLLTVLGFAEKLGAERVLRKPFSRDELVGMVGELLDSAA